jgi:hypothetical protein
MGYATDERFSAMLQKLRATVNSTMLITAAEFCSSEQQRELAKFWQCKNENRLQSEAQAG